MSSKERRGGGAKSNRTRSTQNAVGSSSSPSSSNVEKLRVCQKVIEQLCEDWPELKADEARKAKVHDLIVRLPRQYGLDAHHLEDIETHVTLLERASTKDAPVVHVREVLVGGDEESEKSFDADVEGEDEDEKSNREDTSMSSAPQEGSEYSNRQQSQAKAILRQNSQQQQSLRGLRKPIFGSSATLSTFQGYAGGDAGGSPNSRDGSMNGNSIDSNTSTNRSRLEGTYEIAVCGGNKPRTLSRISTTLFDVGLNLSLIHI